MADNFSTVLSVAAVEDLSRVSSYRGTSDRPDQAKAIAAVVAVHIALAFIIVSGLNVDMVRRAVEQITTVDIRAIPPPPPVEPPPKPTSEPQAMRKPEGASAKTAEPIPVVAPTPKIPTPHHFLLRRSPAREAPPTQGPLRQATAPAPAVRAMAKEAVAISPVSRRRAGSLRSPTANMTISPRRGFGGGPSA